jgi:4-phosphopantoate--beta-alanine ligase
MYGAAVNLTEIPKEHPRYLSLMTRDLIVHGMESGITGIHGLIAQGRGEAFDYLIGEQTIASAEDAQRTGAAMLLLAQNAVISVNGNAAALVPGKLVELSTLLNAPLEVNLFYRTPQRVLTIIEHLRSHGAQKVLGAKPDAAIPGLSSHRAMVCSNGIYCADVVFVPLEDGDRCEALIKMGKLVIAVDLNPLSRTSQCASVSIIDNIIRAVPNLINIVNDLKSSPAGYLQEIIDSYNNRQVLDDAMGCICRNLTNIRG